MASEEIHCYNDVSIALPTFYLLTVIVTVCTRQGHSIYPRHSASDQPAEVSHLIPRTPTAILFLCHGPCQLYCNLLASDVSIVNATDILSFTFTKLALPVWKNEQKIPRYSLQMKNKSGVVPTECTEGRWRSPPIPSRPLPWLGFCFLFHSSCFISLPSLY